MMKGLLERDRKPSQQVFYFLSDLIPNCSKLIQRHRLRARDFPILSMLGVQNKRLILASHSHGHVEINICEVRKSFRIMLPHVIAEFRHCRHSLGMDALCGMATGTVRLDLAFTENAGKRLGHLAAVTVFDADEENTDWSVVVGHGFGDLLNHGTIIDTCWRYSS